ncbi:hypothetical protein [Halomicrococcus gelatinilyticus]|uniref:hypothetical protein n=1 Tax=Halomicrococcus gelatinilyticus TaxID=1702103 RepID=UPI002E107B3F
MRRPSLPFVLVALLVTPAIVAPALTVPAAARPPPEPVCEPCGDGFADELQWHGELHDLNASATVTDVERSTATVRVDENGTVAWTVRNRLANGAAVELLRENGTALAAVAADATPGRLLDARVTTDGVVVLRYRTPDAAAVAPGGAVRFDHFRETRSHHFDGLGADRLTVRGPPGTVVRGAPAAADVDGNALTLTTYGDDGSGFVTFAPPGVTGHALAGVAVADAVWLSVATNLLAVVLFPAALLLAALAGTARLVGRGSGSERCVTRTAAAVGGLGVVVFVAALLALGGFQRLFAAAVATAHVALAALARSDVRPTLPRAVAGVGVAALVGFASALGIAAFVAPWYLEQLATGTYYAVDRAGVAAFATLWLLSMAVVGYAAAERRYRRVAVVGPPVALAVWNALRTPLTYPQNHLSVVLLAVPVVVAAVVVVFGLPAFLLGRAVAAAAE